MKIAVAGIGYVGLSLAVLLAQHNQVVALDILPEKIEKLNNRISPIQDAEIEYYLTEKTLDLRATADPREAYAGADYVIVAVSVAVMLVLEWYEEKHGSVREALAKQNAFVQWAAMVLPMIALVMFGIFRGSYIASEFIYKQY